MYIVGLQVFLQGLYDLGEVRLSYYEEGKYWRYTFKVRETMFFRFKLYSSRNLNGLSLIQNVEKYISNTPPLWKFENLLVASELVRGESPISPLVVRQCASPTYAVLVLHNTATRSYLLQLDFSYKIIATYKWNNNINENAMVDALCFSNSLVLSLRDGTVITFSSTGIIPSMAINKTTSPIPITKISGPTIYSPILSEFRSKIFAWNDIWSVDNRQIYVSTLESNSDVDLTSKWIKIPLMKSYAIYHVLLVYGNFDCLILVSDKGPGTPEKVFAIARNDSSGNYTANLRLEWDIANLHTNSSRMPSTLTPSMALVDNGISNVVFYGDNLVFSLDLGQSAQPIQLQDKKGANEQLRSGEYFRSFVSSTSKGGCALLTNYMRVFFFYAGLPFAIELNSGMSPLAAGSLYYDLQSTKLLTSLSINYDSFPVEIWSYNLVINHHIFPKDHTCPYSEWITNMQDSYIIDMGGVVQASFSLSSTLASPFMNYPGGISVMTSDPKILTVQNIDDNSLSLIQDDPNMCYPYACNIVNRNTMIMESSYLKSISSRTMREAAAVGLSTIIAVPYFSDLGCENVEHVSIIMVSQALLYFYPKVSQ
jgi:hypothetical protein